MSYILKFFLQLPLVIRAVIVLLMILMVWKSFRKVFLKIFSIVPFVIRKIFHGIYLLIEAPIDFAHRKWGTSFYALDNGMSKLSKVIDDKLENWFEVWYSGAKKHGGRLLLLYVLCILWIGIPSFIDINSGVLTKGESIYLYCENKIIDFFPQYIRDEKVSTELLEIKLAEDNEEKKVFEEHLIVFGIKSSLLVRNIPKVEGSTVLTKLHNSDMVLWEGKMVFSEVDSERIEPWVKIRTEDGIEGWSRLYYLRPENYLDKEYVFCY